MIYTMHWTFPVSFPAQSFAYRIMSNNEYLSIYDTSLPTLEIREVIKVEEKCGKFHT